MTHSVQFKARTQCAATAILAYTIEVADGAGAVLETLTLGSGAATTTGITHNAPATPGTLPIIDVDESAIAQDVRVTFVDYTTACGKASVGEFTDVKQAAGGQVTGEARVGCLAIHGIRYMERNGNIVGDGGIATQRTSFVGGDGRAYGFGRHDFGHGTFGWNGEDYGDDHDLNITLRDKAGYFMGDIPIATHFGNLEAYIPGIAIAKVLTFAATGPTLILTESGKVYSFNAPDVPIDVAFPIANGNPTALVTHGNALVPHEIVAPNGLPWTDIIVFAPSTVHACTEDGTWFVWGQSIFDDDVRGGIQPPGTSSTAQIEVPTPREIIGWPVLPRVSDQRDPITNKNRHPFYNLGGTRSYMLITDSGDVWVQGAAVGTTFGSSAWGQIPLPAGVTAVNIHATQFSAGIIGSDGIIYYLGRVFATDPTGGIDFPSGNNTVGNQALPMDMSNIPAGVVPEKIMFLLNHMLMLGSDGILYGFHAGEALAPVVMDAGENADIEDFWAHGGSGASGGVIFRKTDGSVYGFSVVNGPGFATREHLMPPTFDLNLVGLQQGFNSTVVSQNVKPPLRLSCP